MSRSKHKGSRAQRTRRNTRASGTSSAAGGRTARLGLEVHPGPPVAERDLPRVAFVILNMNGRQHNCALMAGRWPKARCNRRLPI